MKLLFTVLFVLFLTHTSMQAQSTKSIYLEFLGAGKSMSINYDMRFTGNNRGIGGRIGIGWLPSFSDGMHVFTLPVGINYLMGKDGMNFFEMGIGITPTYERRIYDECPTCGGSLRYGPFSDSFGWIHIGYRYMPVDNGFTFRIGLTPIYALSEVDCGCGEQGRFVPLWGSLSFGYKF